MAQDKENPTLDDVAKRAGVSTATISRFLNNPSVVAEKSAKKIKTAIEETGYIPNLLAGGLASNKSKLVAVLIPHMVHSIFNDTIEDLVRELSASGSVVMLGLTELDVEQTDNLIMAALSRRAEAIIITGTVSDQMKDLLRRSKTNVIEIWDLPEDPVDIAVGFSHFEIGKEIASFLKERGYIRPHYLSAIGPRAAQRRDGFTEAWKELDGAEVTHDSFKVPLHFGYARAAFANIKRLPQMPDVVVCGSDRLAQGLIIEAQAAGLKVPDDLAVIGFGNSTLAGQMRPTITSIDIDGARIAREATALLQQRNDGIKVHHTAVNVGFKLIARESA